MVRDPFVMLIMLVVLVPALLVAYGVTHQSPTQTAVNSVSNEVADSQQAQTSSTSTETIAPQPITQAEQSIIEEVQPVPVAATTAPVCNQTQKQSAEASKNTQVAQENANHERQKEKIRLISRIYRKYMDDELARHQAAINQINATYQTNLAAANC